MEAKATAKNNGGFLSSLYDVVELFVISICLVLIFFIFGARLCRVDGDSMLQTLHDSEMLVVSNFAYTPEQGDIVVFHQTHETNMRLNEPIVKRIIATEGQYVFVDYSNGKVYVSSDDEFTEEDLLDEDYDYIDNASGVITDPYYARNKTYKVPDGCVFVLGDNRNNSLDSRSYEIGMVDERRILGRVVLRLPGSLNLLSK